MRQIGEITAEELEVLLEHMGKVLLVDRSGSAVLPRYAN